MEADRIEVLIRSAASIASYPVATKSSPSLHPIDYCILSYGDHSFSCKVIFPSGPHSVSQQLTELRYEICHHREDGKSHTSLMHLTTYFLQPIVSVLSERTAQEFS